MGYIITRLQLVKENMTYPLVQYPAILHSKPLNNYLIGTNESNSAINPDISTVVVVIVLGLYLFHCL